MKRFALISMVAIMAAGMISCGGATEKKAAPAVQAEVNETAKVIVYYFHGKQRCKTCLAIQDVAGKTIAENFNGNTDVKFIELDYSEKANETIAEKYEIAGSSLLIVSGIEHANLTEAGFANAVRNPDALKEIIVTEVNKFLAQ